MADLIIHIFYREEKQLAFIRFSPATMQVAPVFVLKDVVQVARCEADQEGASVQLSRGMAQHRQRDQYLGDLSQKVEAFGSAVAVVQSTQGDVLQLYRGTTKLPDFKMMGRIKSLKSIGNDSLEVSCTILEDRRRSTEEKRVYRFDSLALGGRSSSCHLTNSILKILKKTLPRELYTAIHCDLIKQQQISNVSDFTNLSSLLLSWVKQEDLSDALGVQDMAGAFQMKKQNVQERMVEAAGGREVDKKGNKVSIASEQVTGHAMGNAGGLGRRQDSGAGRRPAAAEPAAQEKGETAFQTLLRASRKDQSTMQSLFSKRLLSKISAQE